MCPIVRFDPFPVMNSRSLFGLILLSGLGGIDVMIVQPDQRFITETSVWILEHGKSSQK